MKLGSKSTNETRSAKFWLDVGLLALSEEGKQGLTVERLTERVSKTRGSFYHHFGDLDGYVERLMNYWQSENTERIVDVISKEAAASMRGKKLNQLARQVDGRLERNIRSWGSTDERVRLACEQVDQRRLEIVRLGVEAKAKEADALLSEEEIDQIAMLEYASFVGAQMLAPEGDLTQMNDPGKLSEEMLQLLFAKRSK